MNIIQSRRSAERKRWIDFINDNKKPKNWCALGQNPNITWDMISENSLCPWVWACVGGNPNVTWEIIQANPQIKWSYRHISANPNITWDIVCANPHIPWDYQILSLNKNITPEIVAANPDKPWNMDSFRRNNYHTWDYIRTHISNPSSFPLSMVIARNPNITWKIIKDNPDFPWDWSTMCENPSVTWADIQANPDKPWHWRCTSKNPNVTWGIMQSNPKQPWAWDMVSVNRSITWDIIDANPRIPWDWGFMCYNEMDGVNAFNADSMLRCMERCRAIKEELGLVTNAPAHYYKWVAGADEIAEALVIRADDDTWCEQLRATIRRYRGEGRMT